MSTSINTSNESAVRRIQSVSSILRRICTVLLVLMGIIYPIGIVSMLLGRLTSVALPGETISLTTLTPTGRIVVEIGGLLAAAVTIKAVYHLRVLLTNYSRREIFSLASARQIRAFGIACILWGALKIAFGLVPAFLVTGTRLTFHVELDTLLIGAVIVVLSWFAEMAAALREENDLTI